MPASDRDADRKRRTQLVGPVTLLAFVATMGAALVFLLPSSRELEDLSTQGVPSELSLRHLNALVEANPDDRHLKLLLARQKFATGDVDGAEQTLAPILDGGGRVAVDARRLRVLILTTRFRAAPAGTARRAELLVEVNRTLRESLKDPLDAPDLEESAKIALEIGETRLGAESYERAARAAGDVAGRVELLAAAARWWRASGEEARAARLYDEAARGAAEPSRRRELALLAIDAAGGSGDARHAFELADHWSSELPKDQELLERVARLAAAAGHPDRARAASRRLLEEFDSSDPKAVMAQVDRELAVGDLWAAIHWLKRLEKLRPQDRLVHARLAQLGEWSGDLALAYVHYTWLVEHGREGGPFLDRAIAIARALHDVEALVHLMRRRADHGTPTEAEVLELARMYEESGDPEESARFLRERLRRPGATRTLWRRLATLEEERGQPLLALEAWEHVGALDVGESIRTAELLWRLDRPEHALAMLGRVRETPPRSQTAYWRLVAQLAWEVGSDERARVALGMLYAHGARDEVVLSRIAAIERRTGNLREAARYDLEAYEATGQIDYLIQAAELFSLAGDDERALAVLVAAPVKAPALLRSPPYWERRGAILMRLGRSREACPAFETALRLEPSSVTAFGAALGCALEIDDRAALARHVAVYRTRIEATPDLLGPYGLALVRIGRPREGIVYLTRVVRASPREYAWILELARALEQVGDLSHAYRLRKHALGVLWPRALKALRQADPSPDDTRALLARALLAREIEGVPEGYRWLAMMMPTARTAKADADAADLAVSFYLADRDSEVARRAILAQRASLGRIASTSVRSNEMAIALLDNDIATVEKLLQEPTLPTAMRVEGMMRAGRDADAYRLASDAVRDVEADQDTSYFRGVRSELAERVAPLVEAGFAFDGYGSMGVWGPRATAAYLFQRARLEVGARYGDMFNTEPSIPLTSGREVDAHAGVILHGVRNDTRFFAGANVRPLGALPYASLSHDRELGSGVKAGAAVHFHEVPTDTLLLRAAGVRDEVSANGTIQVTRRDRVTLQGQLFRESTVRSDYLAWGGLATVSAGHKFIDSPSLEAVLSTQALGRDVSGAALSRLQALGSTSPDVPLPPFAVSTAASLQLSRGDPTSPWGRTPFPRYGLSAGAGWVLPNQPSAEARGNIAIRVFGEDALALSAYYATGLVGGAGRPFRGFQIQYARGL